METRKFDSRDYNLLGGQLGEAYLIPLREGEPQPVSIGEFLTIGRDLTNSIQVSDSFVSSRHARVEKRKRGYLLRDMQSRNGTLVNGTSIVEAYLKQNDRILVGESSFVFSKVSRLSEILTSENPQWRQQLFRLPSIANTEYTILIKGPSGSGKEVLSKWVHKNSSRSSGPYVTINCSALSESLVESELFGHIRGSYTGATGDRKGAFQVARGGTLLLDEVGDLPLSLQPKLLRALENKEIRPVGSDRNVQTNVRILAATHKNLKHKVSKGEFREDLFHRLNICQISIPPLVNRMEDFETLLFSFAKEHGVRFSHGSVERLKKHTWPGNVRELKNLVLRSAAYFPGKRIKETDFESLIEREDSYLNSSLYQPERPSLSPLKEMERELLLKSIEKNFGNQKRVAEDLKIPRSTLHDKLKFLQH